MNIHKTVQGSSCTVRHILLPSAFWDFPWRGGERPGAGACLFSLVWITKAFNLDWLLNLWERGACLGHVLLPSAVGLKSPAHYVVPFCNLAGRLIIFATNIFFDSLSITSLNAQGRPCLLWTLALAKLACNLLWSKCDAWFERWLIWSDSWQSVEVLCVTLPPVAYIFNGAFNYSKYRWSGILTSGCATLDDTS